MTQDEAEKLARELRPGNATIRLGGISAEQLRNLCDYILSGSMKREIENAAFLYAADGIERLPEYMDARLQRALSAAYVRSLMQPPAQKENGE